MIIFLIAALFSPNTGLSIEPLPELSFDSNIEPDQIPIGIKMHDDLRYIEERINSGEIDESINWLKLEIRDTEQAYGRYNQALVYHLVLLGDAYSKQEDYGAALQNYRRAIHIERINAGLHSKSQIPIVVREARMLATIENIDAATDRYEYAYNVLERAHEENSLELVDGLYLLGNWYTAINDVYAARSMYQSAMSILAAHGLSNDEKALPALYGIALGYRLERFPPNYIEASTYPTASSGQFDVDQSAILTINNFPAGEQALQQIIAIYRSQPDKFSASQRLEAILTLADWYLLWDKNSRAKRLYAFVHTELNESGEQYAEDYFKEPRLLYFPIPKRIKVPPLDRRGNQLQGQIVLEFDVTKTGYVRRLKTTKAEPKGPMEFRVRKSMRLARYRPAMEDGNPIEYQNEQHSYQFNYFEKKTK